MSWLDPVPDLDRLGAEVLEEELPSAGIHRDPVPREARRTPGCPEMLVTRPATGETIFAPAGPMRSYASSLCQFPSAREWCASGPPPIVRRGCACERPTGTVPLSRGEGAAGGLCTAPTRAFSRGCWPGMIWPGVNTGGVMSNSSIVPSRSAFAGDCPCMTAASDSLAYRCIIASVEGAMATRPGRMVPGVT